MLDFKKGGGLTNEILLTRVSLREHNSPLEIPLTFFLVPG